MRADRALALERLGAREHEMIVRGERGLPAGLHNNRLMRLDDDRGAGHDLARLELITREYVGAVPAAVGEETRSACGRGQVRACGFVCGARESGHRRRRPRPTPLR
jgi:hypothetical protein